jgi:hypothetical protein
VIQCLSARNINADISVQYIWHLVLDDVRGQMRAFTTRVAALNGDGGECQARANGEETWRTPQGLRSTEDINNGNNLALHKHSITCE